MRIQRLFPLAVVLGLLAAIPLQQKAVSAAGRDERPDTLDVEDIKPGMKGYGLTVFEGTQPERFDVEVIDVLHNFRPRQDLILIKTKHPRLEVAKVVAGMSGSPIYLNGKMIGAYAYGWSFGSEPIAGVTPIRNMLQDLGRPLPPVVQGWPLFRSTNSRAGKAPGPTSRLEGAFPGDGSGATRLADAARYVGPQGRYDLGAHRDQLQARLSPALGGVAGQRSGDALKDDATPRRLATPLLLGGMTPGAVQLLDQLFQPLGLEPLQAGGTGSTDAAAPSRYVDGGAVGVELVSGDTSAMGLGTITRVEGDLASGFGHPMMNAGYSALPTSVAKVLWFLASQSRSFKIGMSVRPVGALVNDRQASITVSHSAVAPRIPTHVRISGAPGAPYTDWNFAVAHEKFMSPSFVAVAVGSALETTASERSDVSWWIHSKVKVRGHGEIRVEDFGVAVGGTPGPGDLSRSNLVNAVGAVLNNPWEPAFIESIDSSIELRYARDAYRLRGVELLDPEVDPGKPARIKLTLVPFAGPTVERILQVTLPRRFAGEKVKIEIRPGYTVEKVKAEPENVGDLVARFEDTTYPPQSVVLSYQTGPGVAHMGQVAEDLPAGALDTLNARSTSISPELFKSEHNEATDLGAFLLGRDSVTVRVRALTE